MTQRTHVDKEGNEIEITLGADNGYEAKEFVETCVAMNVVPHVSRNESGASLSGVPRAIAAGAGYSISVQKGN